MSQQATLQDVPAQISFPQEEEKVLAYWKKIKAFETSLEKSKGKKPYTFYDGPPFATGLPHYGHILAGTIKDIVTRYAHQTGHFVERRFGWDCHGLPIEFEIEKVLGIKTKSDVLNFGIANYNNECRKIVMRFANEWEVIVERMGRWIDFKNDYKTMNLTFMESVWWVFKQLFDKNLVYRGFKVMPYSTGCTTALSNFEANSNYKDANDPTVVVSFPVIGDAHNASFLAWTTTPWTLPSNLALCVNPELDYVKIRDKKNQNVYILAESRLIELYKSAKKKDDFSEYEIIEKCKGKALEGKTYSPLFDYFYEEFKAQAFRVVCDNYVTSDSGTGIVHQAPGFGEDDYRVCYANGIIKKGDNIPCPLDANGFFTDRITDYKGAYIKDADEKIMEELKKRGRLIKKGTLIHSYPFCWRSDTPLIYRTVPSWFVAVEQIKDKLLKNNQKTYWVPDFVKTKRFHNWLEDAKDWSVSRSRYWGTPIPLWVSDDFEEVVCVGSIEELCQLTGKKREEVTDIHREFIDNLTIPSQKGKGKLKRVEDVFDCWFESGSMPYAQVHYPFENKEKFEKSFPADFIAEGLDQTRGWFYTLLVLGSALFDEPPFKNLIVNGLVLAADGKKMSKRLKNYTDPMEIVHLHGADALRLYLINSPVVRAEPLRFKDDGVKEVVKDVFLKWYNAYRFFIQNAIRYQKEHGSLFTSTEAAQVKSDNVMDKWIISLNQSLIKFVREEMAAYRLYTVIPKLVQDIDQLTNWFVRLNRKRLKGDNGKEDWYKALATLFTVLYSTIRTMAPFTPFLTEMMYQNLKALVPVEEREDSIHFAMVPEFDQSKVDLKIEKAVERMQEVVETGRNLRDKKNLGLKIPVKEFIVCHMDEEYLKDVQGLESYIMEELNFKSFKVTSEISSFIKLSAETDNLALGPRLKKKLGDVSKAAKALPHEEVVQFIKKGSMEVLGETLTSTDVKIIRTFVGDSKTYEALSVGSALILLDYTQDESLKQEGYCRALCAAVQQLRKKAGLVPEDVVGVFAQVSPSISQAITTNRTLVDKLLKGMNLEIAPAPKDKAVIITSEEDVGADSKVQLTLTKP